MRRAVPALFRLIHHEDQKGDTELWATATYYSTLLPALQLNLVLLL